MIKLIISVGILGFYLSGCQTSQNYQNPTKPSADTSATSHAPKSNRSGYNNK